MGYRRLPTTDKARHTALQKLYDKLSVDSNNGLKINEKKLLLLKDDFGSLLNKRAELAEITKTLNKTKKQTCALLKLYNSHFIQVFNFAIERGEINKTCREYFGLENNMGVLPDLSNEELVLQWSERIILGEQKRIQEGVQTISHPNVGKIKAISTEFKKIINEFNRIEKSTIELKNQIQEQRRTVDEFIKHVWNEIEAQFANETIKVKQQKSSEYGVVYVI